MSTYTAEDVTKALNGLEDAHEKYDQWLTRMHEGEGNWIYLRYYPRSADWHVGAEASECVPVSEWEGKDDLAPVTVLGRSNTGWSPGPEDGYEWDFVGKDDDPDYAVNAKNYTQWCDVQDADDKDWEETRYFRVSSRPVEIWDGYYEEIDREVGDLRKQFEELLENLENPD